MSSKIKKATSIILILVMALTVMPFSAAAVEEKQEQSFAESLVVESENALYSVRAENASSTLKRELQSYNIEINDDSLIELVPLGSGEGTALRTTTVEGNLITHSSLMSVTDDGDVMTLAATDLSADSIRVYPFGDNFEILFIYSYYAYPVGLDLKGLIQPQTAMFQYFDDEQKYDVTQLTMDYCCSGVDGTWNGSEFNANPNGTLMVYRIRNSVANPRRNYTYSETSPYPSNRAIQIYLYDGGGQGVDFRITGWRNKDNKYFAIEDTLMF